MSFRDETKWPDPMARSHTAYLKDSSLGLEISVKRDCSLEDRAKLVLGAAFPGSCIRRESVHDRLQERLKTSVYCIVRRDGANQSRGEGTPPMVFLEFRCSFTGARSGLLRCLTCQWVL